MKTAAVIFLLVLVLCTDRVKQLSMPAGQQGQTRYVATTGNDTNSGSLRSPWRTIRHATDVVNPGDTVIVEDGVYAENFAFTRSGTAAAPIVFKSQHKWGAKITPSGSGNLLYFSHADYVTIQDFEITGTPTDNDIIKIDTGQHNSIIGNKLHGSGVSSTACLSGAAIVIADSYATVEGNFIYDNGPLRSAAFRCNQHHGVYVTAGDYGTIQNNVIFESWQGVALHLFSHGFSHWTVSNNTVFNSGDAAHDSGGPFLFGCLGSGVVCDNNVFNNNILVDNQRRAFYEDAADSTGTFGSHNVYQNNLLYNTGNSTFVTGKESGTVTTDPLFVNYTGDENGDYHLHSNSPAIQRGTRNGPMADFDGTPRPQGASPDIGAFQQRGKKAVR